MDESKKGGAYRRWTLWSPEPMEKVAEGSGVDGGATPVDPRPFGVDDGEQRFTGWTMAVTATSIAS